MSTAVNKAGRMLVDGSFTACSVVSRARHCVQDARIVIVVAQKSSECNNLDAQIVLLDTQNRSIGIQLVDIEN